MSGRNEIVPVPLVTFLQLKTDAFLWAKVSALMTHERSGPNAGWTLSIVLPGDSPADAVNDFKGT